MMGRTAAREACPTAFASEGNRNDCDAYHCDAS
jgi:hypothetical protein